MTTKKDNFNPDEPGIIAHSQVQVIASANWGETNIPVFNPGIRINLSLMAGQHNASSPKTILIIARVETKFDFWS